MNQNEFKPRRTFLKKTFIGTGATLLGASAVVKAGERSQSTVAEPLRLPREVWVASFCQQVFEANNHQDMVSKVLKEMDYIVKYRPDIICLPETFPFVNIKSKKPPIQEVAEPSQGGGQIIRKFSARSEERRVGKECRSRWSPYH